MRFKSWSRSRRLAWSGALPFFSAMNWLMCLSSSLELLPLFLFSSTTLASSWLSAQFCSLNNSGKMLNLWLFSWRELSLTFLFYSKFFLFGKLLSALVCCCKPHIIHGDLCCFSWKDESKTKVSKEVPQANAFFFSFFHFLSVFFFYPEWPYTTLCAI